jgi:4'-phosphopantetheinyl transferase
MKYTGLGFNLNLDSFEIIINDKITLRDDKEDIKFNLFDINEYKLAVASEYDIDKCVKYDVEKLY